MSDEIEPTWFKNIAAMGRDVLTMTAVISIIFAGAVSLARPYWQPFAELPAKMGELELEITKMRAVLNDTENPQIVVFHGVGQIINKVNAVPGGSVTVFYSLRRNASCDTVVRPFFFNVDNGLTVAGQEIPAVKAPVTINHIPFRIDIALPSSIPPGRYVYYPEIVPINCGVYKSIRVPPTEVFVVRPE